MELLVFLALLKVPEHQLTRKARDSPCDRYRGRPANDLSSSSSSAQNMISPQKAICTETMSRTFHSLGVRAQISVLSQIRVCVWWTFVGLPLWIAPLWIAPTVACFRESSCTGTFNSIGPLSEIFLSQSDNKNGVRNSPLVPIGRIFKFSEPGRETAALEKNKIKCVSFFFIDCREGGEGSLSADKLHQNVGTFVVTEVMEFRYHEKCLGFVTPFTSPEHSRFHSPHWTIVPIKKKNVKCTRYKAHCCISRIMLQIQFSPQRAYFYRTSPARYFPISPCDQHRRNYSTSKHWRAFAYRPSHIWKQAQNT